MKDPQLYLVHTEHEDPRIVECRRQVATSPEIANLVAALTRVARRIASTAEGAAQHDQAQTHPLLADR